MRASPSPSWKEDSARTVHRIFKRQLLAGALSGEGARRFGGRWNHEGYSVVYTSQHLSLAALEVLVHAQGRSALADLLCLEIQIPNGLSETLPRSDLPPDWRSPDPPEALRDLGTRWLVEQRSVALWVPSAVIAKEHNVLVNPRHPDFTKLTVTEPEPFDFDPRLIACVAPA